MIQLRKNLIVAQKIETSFSESIFAQISKNGYNFYLLYGYNTSNRAIINM